MESLSSFRLLDLPPELWTRFCRFLVERDDAIIVNYGTTQSEAQRVLSQPGITCTCKIIRLETLTHFYAANSFELVLLRGPNNHNYLKAWLRAIGPENWSRIQSSAVWVPLLDIVRKTMKMVVEETMTKYLRQSGLPFVVHLDTGKQKQTFLGDYKQIEIFTLDRFRIDYLAQ